MRITSVVNVLFLGLGRRPPSPSSVCSASPSGNIAPISPSRPECLAGAPRVGLRSPGCQCEPPGSFELGPHNPREPMPEGSQQVLWGGPRSPNLKPQGGSHLGSVPEPPLIPQLLVGDPKKSKQLPRKKGSTNQTGETINSRCLFSREESGRHRNTSPSAAG